MSSLGSFCVGVAAFPTGHPRSPNLHTDTDHLVAKIEAGADFAVAQICFEADELLWLRDRLATRGCDVPLLPGIMPLTTKRTLAKAQELSGVPGPGWLENRLEPYADDPPGFRSTRLDVIADLGDRLLAEGVRGLHFYTLNRSTATRELVDRLGLAPAIRQRSVA